MQTKSWILHTMVHFCQLISPNPAHCSFNLSYWFSTHFSEIGERSRTNSREAVRDLSKVSSTSLNNHVWTVWHFLHWTTGIHHWESAHCENTCLRKEGREEGWRKEAEDRGGKGWILRLPLTHPPPPQPRLINSIHNRPILTPPFRPSLAPANRVGRWGEVAELIRPRTIAHFTLKITAASK